MVHKVTLIRDESDIQGHIWKGFMLSVPRNGDGGKVFSDIILFNPSSVDLIILVLA